MSKTMSETMLMTKRTSSKFTMASAALLALCATAALIAQVPAGTLAMRNGAPSYACSNMKPGHGAHQPKPASASQFYVWQSSLTYTEGQNITVEVATQSNERHFRGFLVQAYDPSSSSGTTIGRFQPTADSQPVDECSAATHRDNAQKKSVTLIWTAPTEPPASGHKQVRFRATIVVAYDEFYTGFDSSVEKFDFAASSTAPSA